MGLTWRGIVAIRGIKTTYKELFLKVHVHSNHKTTFTYAEQNAGNTTNECTLPSMQDDSTVTNVKSTGMAGAVRTLYVFQFTDTSLIRCL